MEVAVMCVGILQKHGQFLYIHCIYIDTHTYPHEGLSALISNLMLFQLFTSL